MKSLTLLMLLSFLAVGCATLTPAEIAANQERLEAREHPITHPLEYLNLTVDQVKVPMIIAAGIVWLLWVVWFALNETGHTFVPSLTKIFLLVAILLSIGVFILPLLPWGILFVIVAAIALIGYELFRDKGNIPQAIKDAEIVVGVEQPSQVTAATSVTVTKGA